jgi:hypothetical protein
LPVSITFIYTSLEFLIKVLLTNINFTLLSKALRKECPTMFPKTGLLCKQTPISRALLIISFGVPTKGALPPGSSQRAAIVRDAPFPEPSFIRLSKSLVNEPPSKFPSGAHVERDARLRAFLYITFRVPSKESIL